MFETAEIAHEIDKATWKAEEPDLRQALLDAQFELLEQKRFATLILIAGVDGAGKSETSNLLNEWMDPRHIATKAFGPADDEDRQRPYMYRYWQHLPARGRIGIFFGAWHSMPVVGRALGRISKGKFEDSIDAAQRMERVLTDEGVLLVKFWFHLTKVQQKERLEELASKKSTRWRVGEHEWAYFRRYDNFLATSEQFVRATSTGTAPWYVVNGSDPRYRALTVGRTLLAALRQRLDEKEPDCVPDTAPPLLPPVDRRNVIRSLELDQELDEERYDKLLEKWQGRLNLLSRDPRYRKISVVAVFEGNDAAGKGGAIRRVISALDARTVRPIPVAAPTEEERAQPYLWRFWRHLPRRGQLAIFDRSWYGRVLVERVEELCPRDAWMRAYQEISDFEAQLVDAGSVLVKFWLAISKEEQLQRFEHREATPHKRFKITAEDWRNREKWNLYEEAVCDMVDRTSTAAAPWTLVEANNKYFARIKVMKTLCKAIEAGLDKVD